jgi:hypothetical protein
MGNNDGIYSRFSLRLQFHKVFVDSMVQGAYLTFPAPVLSP